MQPPFSITERFGEVAGFVRNDDLGVMVRPIKTARDGRWLVARVSFPNGAPRWRDLREVQDVLFGGKPCVQLYDAERKRDVKDFAARLLIRLDGLTIPRELEGV